jgi:peptide/nickel transport system substrate-binding protein
VRNGASVKRRFILGILVLVVMVGCRSDRSEAGASEGGRLVRAMTSEPGTLDPQGRPSSGLSLVLPYLYDTLVVRDTANEIHPLLAESWETSEDGLVVTMTLKEDITFHDGTPLDAEAVKFTFDRFREVGTRSPIYIGMKEIKSMEVLDRRTVQFHFDTPTPTFWSTISMPYAGIISPSSVARAEEDDNAHPVGSGPFMLTSWERGHTLVLKRNPDYTWGPPIVDNQGPPHLSELVFRVIPDATTQLTALKTGEVDVLFVNRPAHKRELEGAPDVNMEEAVLNSLIYLGFNCEKPPLDDPRVRRALAHAVIKEEIVDLALDGMGNPAFAPLPPTIQGFDPSLEKDALGYNPDKAMDLLEAAGFTKGGQGWQRKGETLTLDLLTSTRAPNADIAALIQSHLKAIDVTLSIQQLESRAVMQTTGEGTHDLLLWRYDWNDPDALRIFLSSQRIGSSNRVYYSNPTFDALVEQAAHELDEDTRMRLYLEAQELLLKDAPWQPLYNPIDVIAMRTRVQDAHVGYMGRLLLNDATISHGD